MKMKIVSRGFAVPLVAALMVASTATPGQARPAHGARCRQLACLSSPGATLSINRVEYWGPGATDPSQQLIALRMTIADTTGPRNYPTTDPAYKHRGILDPRPDADAFNGSYYIVDSTGAVDAEYSNGCRYQSGDPSNPFLVYNLGPNRNRLLYPHQSERNVWLCFQVHNAHRRMRFLWYPNYQHNRGYRAGIPAARRYSGPPVPTN